jgi:hypothetical protein
MMNTANLQLEGLLLAMASLHRQLVDKGVLTTQEIDRSLASCEAIATGSDRSAEDLSPANRDAIAFPIRLLRAANSGQPGQDFGALAREVGKTKGKYADQL